MRRHLKYSLFSLLVSASVAQATMLINPPTPYPRKNMGDTGAVVISYAANKSTTLPNNSAVNTGQSYRLVNVSSTVTTKDPASLILVDISSSQQFQSSAGRTIVITLSLSTNQGYNSGVEVPLTGAGIVTGEHDLPAPCTQIGTCQGGVGSNKSAIFSNNQIMRLAFSVADLCTANGGAGASDLCNRYLNLGSGGADLTATLSQTIYVTIGPADPASGVGPTSTSPTQLNPADTSPIEQLSFNLQLTNVPPVITNCPGNEADYYFPGDGQIYIKGGNFSPSTNGTGVDLQSLVFLAKPTSSGSIDAIPGGLTTNPIVSYPELGGQPNITGFNNSLSYNTLVYAQNIAGIVGGVVGGGGCAPNGFLVQSRSIQGVLAESKCFIATAAYQDGRVAPVMMLRRFRDRILSRFEFGRKFIDTYYAYSPALAEWAWDKPIIRSIALRALAPIEFLAWAWLELSHAEDGPNTSSQPYIDRLKKQLEEEDQRNGKVNPDSSEGYTEQEKKKLPNHAVPTDQTYLDRLKKTLPPEESSENYTDKEKANLPPESERESPIQAVKAGRDRKLGRGEEKPIRNAVGFKLGVSPGMDVIANGGPHTYDEVYDSSWKPDFFLHFEHQFIHSENFGSLAGAIDLGINYAAKYGLFDSDFPTGSGNRTSITKFTFLQIPLIVSGYYRFNLARILRPYVGVGVGSIFYDEIRDDDVKNKSGYSFVYTTSVGISLLLDFFDSATSRDGYLSMGIQHTYLSVEYMYLNSFTSDVTFKRGGIYAGFLFEI